MQSFSMLHYATLKTIVIFILLPSNCFKEIFFVIVLFIQLVSTIWSSFKCFSSLTVCNLFLYKIIKPSDSIYVFYINQLEFICMSSYKISYKKNRVYLQKNSEDLLGKVAYIMVQSVVEFRPYNKYQLQTARHSYLRSCMSD